METRIPVKEIMTRNVLTAKEDISAQKASKKMLEENVGSVVILDKEEVPIGMLTERDLVRKVISQDRAPSDVEAQEIMTRPLITIEPELSLDEAVRKMRDLEVKKLPVVEEEVLKGIITESDVLTVSPAINEIATEVAKINQERRPSNKSQWSDPGICENCGTYSKDLEVVDGTLLCEQCRDELELGE